MERGILKINLNKKSFLKKIIIVYLPLLFLSTCAESSNQSFGIATRHHLATDIGMNVLQEGGNAIDAALQLFCLAVVNRLRKFGWRRFYVNSLVEQKTC